MSLDSILEQAEAKRLLGAALREGPAHAYLVHGPPGVGKEAAAKAFAAELLGSPDRIDHETHPDLYVLRQFGQMIRLDEIHELHRDLQHRVAVADQADDGRTGRQAGQHAQRAQQSDAFGSHCDNTHSKRCANP